MANAQAAVLPPALRESRFFADFGGVSEIDLAGYRKNLLVVERLEQWREKIRLHAHVAVEQYDDIVACRAKPGIGPAAETEITIEHQHFYRWKVFPQKFSAAVGRCILDDDDFVIRIAGQRLDDRRQIFREKVAPVPVRNHYCGGCVGTPLVRR